ncbi:MAG: GNAT family N-acetyltransferase [Alphaproteobacteria bacterium]|nr:GNAT family N-acetyltransferase [Alphaproteobacteria bacterium]
MRPEFDRNAQITVRQIGPEDWEAYRDFYMSLRDPHHFRGILAGKDPDDRATWQGLFDATTGTGDYVMFGMEDRKRLIGQSGIQFLRNGDQVTALLAGSEIADDRRGQRLVDKLYQARREYLRSINFQGPVITTISPGNTNSRTAAERNGFSNTGRFDEHGYCIYVPEDLG